MNSKEDTAFKWALKRGDVKKVQELLGKGADPNYLKIFGNTLCRTPMTQNHVEIARLFLEAGAIVDQELVQEILKHRQYALELVTHVLHHHNDVGTLKIIFEKLAKEDDFKGTSVTKIVELLLDRGLPINDRYKYKCASRTPVHIFTIRSEIDCVSINFNYSLYKFDVLHRM